MDVEEEEKEEEKEEEEVKEPEQKASQRDNYIYKDNYLAFHLFVMKNVLHQPLEVEDKGMF